MNNGGRNGNIFPFLSYCSYSSTQQCRDSNPFGSRKTCCAVTFRIIDPTRIQCQQVCISISPLVSYLLVVWKAGSFQKTRKKRLHIVCVPECSKHKKVRTDTDICVNMDTY
jgi:hypothetical protein